MSGAGGSRYVRWGYTFRVDWIKSTGKWACMGHAAGRPAYFLDRLGTHPDECAAQRALDAWAARNCCKRVGWTIARQGRLDL